MATTVTFMIMKFQVIRRMCHFLTQGNFLYSFSNNRQNVKGRVNQKMPPMCQMSKPKLDLTFYIQKILFQLLRLRLKTIKNSKNCCINYDERTVIVSLLTTTSPFGVTIATSSNFIHPSMANTFPKQVLLINLTV